MTEHNRRRVLQQGLGLGVALFGAASARAEAAPLPRTVQWPAQVTLLDGRTLSAAALNAQPALVVFWSTTCPFCRRHNEHVEKLQRAAVGTRLLVLGVAVDGDRDKVLEHARRQGYSFPITLDSKALGATFDTRRVIPRTYAVEAGSRLVSAAAGEMFEEDVMEYLQLARPA
jgi:thiol-disulfide isomerase/thioredoxin